MTKFLASATLVAFLLLFGAATLRAQNPAKTELLPEQERALALVSEQLDELKAVEPKWRRVDLLIQAATVLWKHRQAKAREVFQSAFDLAKESVASKEDTSVKGAGGGSVVMRSDLRLEVIRAIARHDARWAQRLSDEVLTEEKAAANQAAGKSGGRDFYSELPYQAEQLLEIDQPLALSTARQSLAQARGDMLVRFLVALAKQDRAKADTFFLEALAALSTRSINETLSLSSYPFATLRPIGASWLSVAVLGAADLQPSPALQARYLETLLQLAAQLAQQPVATEALTGGAYQLSPAARLLTGFNDLEPLVATQFEPLYGRFLEAKRSLTAVVSAEFMKTVQGISETKREEATGNALERNLAAAEQEKDPNRKDYQYFKAIYAGINTEPPEQLENLLFKIKDLSTRCQLGDWLYYNLAQRLLKAGQIDEAVKFVERVGVPDLRACISFQVAEAAMSKQNDRQRATELLDAAWRVAEKAEVTNEKARALLGIARLYLKIDRGQALSALRAAVKTINQLENADVSQGRFVKTVKGAGFSMFAAYEVPEMTLAQSFRGIGEVDFETALSIAQELVDRVLRAGAVLALSSFSLEKAPRPSPAAKPSAPKPASKGSGFSH